MNYARMMKHKKEGEACLRRNDFPGAEKSLLLALEEAEKNHQPNAYTLRQQNVMGVFYFAMGRLQEAEDHLKKALGIERLLFGSNSIELCSGLNLLGLLYHVNQQYLQAEESYKEALEIQEKAAFSKIPEANSKTFHMSLHHLAMVYCCQGDSDKALNICRQASDRIGQITGPGGRNLTIDFQNIAVKCCSEGKQSEAHQTCRWMLDLCFRELQKEFLGCVIEEGGLGRLGLKPSHLDKESDALASLYEEVWRPGDNYRQAPPISRPPSARIADDETGLVSGRDEDLWRPQNR